MHQDAGGHCGGARPWWAGCRPGTRSGGGAQLPEAPAPLPFATRLEKALILRPADALRRLKDAGFDGVEGPREATPKDAAKTRTMVRAPRVDEVTRARVGFAALPLLALAAMPPSAAAQPVPDRPVRPTVVIPRVDQAPALEDFLDMKPGPRMAGRMLKVTGFTQTLPRDGEPVSQATDAYLAYDSERIYVVIVAFDAQPELIRARMTPREKFSGDDKIDVFLDTFHDERRAYGFTCNPLGVQMDGRWTEGGNFDSSFNAIWQSKGRITDRGFVIWMAIPFRSLRFPAVAQQEWGLVIIRWIPRNNENSAWPWVKGTIDGRLNQGATMVGIEGIAPGRDVQLVPYGFVRSFRALDTQDPERVAFAGRSADPDVGLDAKFVIANRFALDAAVNPDFSQIESDEPQITVNRRFEVFFRERRPFFLENADFFSTPINLFFSRRITEPRVGLRLTGKEGPYTIGAIVADDEAPGKAVPPGDRLRGSRAKLGVVRVNRDLFRNTTAGFLFTDRELAGGRNRVGSVDSRFKLTPNWVGTLQAATSSTRSIDGAEVAGQAYAAALRREGRHFTQSTEYLDFSPGFQTQTGFVSRTGIRSAAQQVNYLFRPQGRSLLSWGPSFGASGVWAHDGGVPLDWELQARLNVEFTRQTKLGVFYRPGRERLRPRDFAGLAASADFSTGLRGLSLSSQHISALTFSSTYTAGRVINLVPPRGAGPAPADSAEVTVAVTARPNRHLLSENTYIMSRLTSVGAGERIFSNHIVRSRWNWQFSPELSLRVILQYDAVFASPPRTRLETRRNLNADVLFTYLLNPWTALHVGYNGNRQNIALQPTDVGRRVVRAGGMFEDARQVFVKVSYLVPL